jgi:nitrogen regulatory protein PII
MIMIEAVIKPFVLDRVREALGQLGVGRLTEYSVSHFGADRPHLEIYRGAEYQVDAVPRVKVDLVVQEEMEERVVAAIVRAAKTGQGGDGSIFVMPVSKAIPIGNGQPLDRAV